MTRQAVPGEPTGATVEFPVHFRTGNRGRRRMRTGTAPRRNSVEKGRIPRISRLMALAIHYDQLIRKGVIRDYAHIAELGGISRSRVSQVMDLLNLAPGIQEEILFLPRTLNGIDVVSERCLRHLIKEADWSRQRDGRYRMGQSRPCTIETAARSWQYPHERRSSND